MSVLLPLKNQSTDLSSKNYNLKSYLVPVYQFNKTLIFKFKQELQYVFLPTVCLATVGKHSPVTFLFEFQHMANCKRIFFIVFYSTHTRSFLTSILSF